MEPTINGPVAAVVSVLLEAKGAIHQPVFVVIPKEPEIRTKIYHPHHLLLRLLHRAVTNLLRSEAPYQRYKRRKFQELSTTNKLGTNHGATVITFNKDFTH